MNKTIRTYLLGVLSALILVAAAWGTKVVNYTLQNCARTDIQSITIRVDPASGNPVETVRYQIREAGGSVVKTGELTIALTGPQITSLLSHIDTVVRPAVDTLEGL